MALVLASQRMQPKAGLIHVAWLSGGAQHVQDATDPRDVCRVQAARVIALVETSQSFVLDVHESVVSWRASRFNLLTLIHAPGRAHSWGFSPT